MPYLNEFPGCCGISVIEGFEDIDYTEEELKHNLQEHRDEYRGLILVALADYQIKDFGPFMTKNKFKPLMKFRNPRHNSMITLYAKKTPRKRMVGMGLW
jgi:hypothetical protein